MQPPLALLKVQAKNVLVAACRLLSKGKEMGGEGRGNGGMEEWRFNGGTVLLSRVREPAGRVALCANLGRLLTTLNFHCCVHTTNSKLP